MIQRPKNLEIVDYVLNFNFLKFRSIEIDLAHINKENRSSFKASEIVLACETFINNKTLVASGTAEFDDEMCSYFVVEDIWKTSKYRLVFCICSDRPAAIGIITFFKMRG